MSAALSTKSLNYTLTSSDSWVNVTGTTTITVPHELTGQRWNVKNTGTNIVTLAPDSGTIDGVASIPLLPQNSTGITCDGSDCETDRTFPYVVAEVNCTGLSANLPNPSCNGGSGTLYTLPAGGAGMYQPICYVVVTMQGSGSTLPACQITYSDNDSSVPNTYSLTATVGNNPAAGTEQDGVKAINAKAGTNIAYDTTGYTGTQVYAIHIRLECLGP